MKNEHFVMIPRPADHFQSTATQTPLSFSTTSHLHKSCEMNDESNEDISKKLQTKTTLMKDIKAARNEILRWRTVKLQEINESEYEDDTRLLQKEMIHHRELKLLQKVDAMEKDYALSTRKRKIDCHLHKLSCDQVWELQSGPCLVESQTIIHRKNLALMYRSLEDYGSQKGEKCVTLCDERRLACLLISRNV